MIVKIYRTEKRAKERHELDLKRYEQMVAWGWIIEKPTIEYNTVAKRWIITRDNEAVRPTNFTE
jgi:hypothetical protein